MDYKEKARRYDEALERAKDFINGEVHYALRKGENIMCWVFPELRESEDERIRKALVKYFSNFDTESLYTVGITEKEVIAWLEKQKPSEEAMKYLKENHSPSEVSDFQAAMNIAVAKAYDRGRADAIAEKDPCRTCDHPTMSCINFPCEKKQGEQRTAWSEEDEKIRLDTIRILETASPIPQGNGKVQLRFSENILWLKSLRPQPHWKPSEEQLKALRYFITSNLPRYNESTSGWTEFDNIQSLYNDLKKLREE